MPLTLVTGPANAAKAAVVLDGVAGAIARGPLLVVPTAQDVDRYRRELAERGVVFGARVLRFADLVDEMAARAEVGGRPLGELARARIVAAVAARARLDVLAASAATPGFAPAAARLFSELEVARVEPGRFAGALRAWGAGDAGRAAYGEDLARLYGAYRGALERLGRRDAELHALAALDALRLRPAAWGATPVFFYGFDDLTPLQLDAVETLGMRVGADVVVSLAYEAGRAAFAGRARTFEELKAAGGVAHALAPRAEHYAAASRTALHGLERALFEEDAPAVRLDPGEAVALLEAGGERAELELVGAEVLRLLRGGVPAEEIAVVVRSPEESGPLVERVFGELGIPFALRRRVAFGHTAAGRGLLALLRCAALDGTAEDAVAFLRAPRVLLRGELADRLEAHVRRVGLRTAGAALQAWADDGRDVPAAIERVRAAAAAGPAELCRRLAAELGRMLGRPGSERGGGEGPVLTAAGRAEAQVVAAGRRALDELAALARDAPELAGGAAEIAAALAAVEVVLGEEAAPGRVGVTDPLAIRARRVRALVLCGLQGGDFPRPARPDALLGDDERRELARASGIRLPHTDDGGLGAERYLFYATVSRPEERLVLSFRTADDQGGPEVSSLFLDDVSDLFSEELWTRRTRRPLGALAWDGEAPTSRAAARAATAARPPRPDACAGPLRLEPVLRDLRERPAWSASSLEAWNACPVRWFVERYLEAGDLEGDSEPQARGRAAHEALEVTLRGLLDDTGSARITPARLGEIRERLRAVLAEVAEHVRLSPNPERLRAGARRLEADLMRYLEAAAHDGGTYEPRFFEAGFGFEEDPESHPALVIDAPDGPVRLRGRIDRVDVDPATGRALVLDYKSRQAPPGEKWEEKGSFQAALYLRAAADLLGVTPGGGFYQPLGGPDLRRRGLIEDDVEPDLDVVGTDRRPPERVGEILEAIVGMAGEAAAQARAGRLEPRPDTCTPNNGCAHPALCRCVTP